MEKLAYHTWLLWKYSFKSLERYILCFLNLCNRNHFQEVHQFLPLLQGCPVWLKVCLKQVVMYASACLPSHNMTFLPLVMQSSVASLFLIITDIPIHKDNFPGKWFVAEWGRFQWFLQGRTYFIGYMFPDAFDFLPLDRFSAPSGGLPNL